MHERSRLLGVTRIAWRELTALLGILMSVAASAQVPEVAPPSPNLADPFFKDANAGYHFRSFYIDRENTNGSVNQAWAAGGWLYARSGYWRDTLQLGATYYFSLPVDAPADKAGTQLLTPDQSSIGVLGELYLRVRYEKQTLTLYRQEIDMGYPRPAGVRSNRSDLSYVGKLDNRLLPLSYEAALLGGPIALEAPVVESLRYWAGYLRDVKPRDSSDFVSIGEAIGAKGSEAGMSMAGLQWSPAKDLWAQVWYHHVPNVLEIGFLDLDYVSRMSEQSFVRLATQYTSQTSADGTALTGAQFSTWNWAAYGEFGWQWLTLYAAYSTVDQSQRIRTPFSSGPIYTQMVTRSFTRAGEDTFLLGMAVSLRKWLPGLSFWVDVADGRHAVNPTTGQGLPDEREVDVGIVWTYRAKGSAFDGVRARLRNAWVADYGQSGTQRGTDLRLDINWPIPFL